MDANHVDRIARAFARSGPRRGVLETLAALPLLGGRFTLLDPDHADAQGRRKRRKKAHKHGRGRRRKHHKKDDRPKTVRHCHAITTSLIACSTGATEFCLTVPIEATNSSHARAACEACYGTDACQIEGCDGASWWQGPLPVNTPLAFQYIENDSANPGDIVGGYPGAPPYAVCLPTASRWAP